MQAQYSQQTSQGTETSEDWRIVSGVLAKDRKATAEFVSHCANWIYPVFRRRLLPRTELVEDLLQEILFTAWQALPNFRGDANLRSWVMGIARHKLDDYYRKKIHKVEIPEGDELLPEQVTLPAFEQGLDCVAQQKRVQRTLRLLPEAYCASPKSGKI